MQNLLTNLSGSVIIYVETNKTATRVANINALDVFQQNGENMRKNYTNHNIDITKLNNLRARTLSDLFETVALINMSGTDDVLIDMDMGDHIDIVPYWKFFQYFMQYWNVYGDVNVDSVYKLDGYIHINVTMVMC